MNDENRKRIDKVLDEIQKILFLYNFSIWGVDAFYLESDDNGSRYKLNGIYGNYITEKVE